MNRIKRRRLLLAAGALAAPFARAQTRGERVRTIGYLSQEAVDPKVPSREYPSTKELAKLGWIEGQNIVIERRFAAREPERMAGLVQELLSKRVELIITVGPVATVAAARATRTTPIVFVNIAFPIEQGLIDSFARPGRNVTGATFLARGVGGKRMEFLREVAPEALRVYTIHPADFGETVDGKRIDVTTAAHENFRRMGFQIQEHVVGDAKDVEAALAGALSWGARAISVGGGSITESRRQIIADFALRHRLPSAFASASFVEAGGLLSYSISPGEYRVIFNRSMEHVDRILRGANPADLPVDQPRAYQLAINLKTAGVLGLTIPRSTLLRADRVIE